ncbi:MAG: hypothetical protein A2076_11210 [Geobacteraceae bacterium GWC2_53_11]|nr:MAG: hypothetical protein A2076_11210 [Geobacteraceae bacterium GWC2_53_11]
MRRTIYFTGLCLVLTMGLYGCGSSTTADSEQASAQAKSAKASFSVTIPQKATKSLIPSATSYVYVSWIGFDVTTGSYAPGELYLYPDASGRATGSADLIPGTYAFTAQCFDSNNSLLSTAESLANVSSGTNNILISFISGRWTFASPITLSQGEKFNSFDVAPSVGSYTGDYPATWNIIDSSGAALALPGTMSFMSISGDLSALAASMGFPSLTAGSQFDLIGVEYNITQGTSNGVFNQGDRVIMATSMGPGDGTGSSSPDISSYFNTKLTSGTALSGTLLEFTYGTFTSTPVATPTGMCAMQQPFKKASFRSAALQAAIGSRAVKSAGTSIGSVTLTYKSCDYAPVGGETFTDTNGNGYYDSAEFLDVNGNGVYDAGIDFPYTDYNGNGIYDPGEPFVDANLNGYYDYGTSAFTEVSVTETVSNLIVYPFTATGTELKTAVKR